MPLYDQIVQDILDQIQSHALKKGDMLPTEMELGQKYGVSRPTVRTAMLKLVNQGYLTRIKGKGTFVTQPKLTQESTQFIESYNDEMRSKGLTPRTVVLDLQLQEGSGLVCEKLGLVPKSRVIRLRRLRYVLPSQEERPVLLTTVYIPYAMAPQLLDYDFEVFSLYEVLEKGGIVVTKVVRELEVRLLHGQTARILEAKDGAPAHFISSVGYRDSGEAVEYSETFYPADRNKFIIKISR